MKISTAVGHSFHQIGERDNQEDSRFPDADRSRKGQMFFVVCDGIGGSERGELASSIVAAHFGKRLSKMNLNESFGDKQMLEVLDDAYIALDNAANDSNRDMGTTLTMLCFHAGGCVMAHIGDSRIYHIRPQQGIIYRSYDHSLVNQLLRIGQITPEEAAVFPDTNEIVRSMGPTESDQRRHMATVCYSTDVKEGDYFVLCSDGVLHCVTDEELVELLCSPLSDEEKVAELANVCASSPDNNTAWVVRIEHVELTAEEQEAAQTGNVSVPTLRDLESVTRGKSTLMTRFRKLFS